jgi:glycine/betaine/sarcosine/D-proline reductase family selenoprotein B
MTDDPPSLAHGAEPPIRYIERTRAYYQALGYRHPYRWAHFDDVPFTPFSQPLAQCRIALVTTAAPVKPDAGDQGPGAAYNAAAKFYRVYRVPVAPPPDLRISHIAYDRTHTGATDPATWLPLGALEQAAAAGRIGGIAAHVHGLPTNRSQRATSQTDAPALLMQLLADGADAAILVPNCPVCHQSCAIAARHLEAHGIATVIMGAALDIVEHVGVPRFLFSDFPLGNSAGLPHDPQSQHLTLALALDLLETASAPRTTHRSPLVWNGDPSWKRDYCAIEQLTPEASARARAAFDEGKATARAIRARQR